MEYEHDFKHNKTIIKYSKGEWDLLEFVKVNNRVLVSYDKERQDIGDYFSVKKLTIAGALDLLGDKKMVAEFRGRVFYLVDLSFATDAQLGFLLREFEQLEKTVSIVLLIDKPLHDLVGYWTEWGEVLSGVYKYYEFYTVE